MPAAYKPPSLWSLLQQPERTGHPLPLLYYMKENPSHRITAGKCQNVPLNVILFFKKYNYNAIITSEKYLLMIP